MMTVLGTVPFLDHFSDLYGNRLTKAARRQSDAVLKAVLRVFFLQWLSTTDTLFPDSFNGSQTVRDPLEMHSMMPGSRHEHSFGRRSQLARSELYMQPRSLMVLLFQPKFTGQLSLSLRIKFLMRVCKSLFLLITLVKEYCATLGSSSVYSALLEPSLSVMRWGGYIRDNGAALTTDHH